MLIIVPCTASTDTVPCYNYYSVQGTLYCNDLCSVCTAAWQHSTESDAALVGNGICGSSNGSSISSSSSCRMVVVVVLGVVSVAAAVAVVVVVKVMLLL